MPAATAEGAQGRLPWGPFRCIGGPPLRGCLAALLLGAAPLAPAPGRTDPAPRPADLRILQERTNLQEGTVRVGVFGREPEADQPGLWRIRVWREWSDRVEVNRESIDCRPGQATRVGVVGGRVVVQTLNPGGAISAANRLDHLIWWAACAPEETGRDPAQLGAAARRLGFDGLQVERIEVLPGRVQPHP